MSLWRALGPVMPRAQLGDMLRGAVGAGLGLVLTGAGLAALAGHGDAALGHPLLIAPFGASALLIFVVPNSPLAQPWLGRLREGRQGSADIVDHSVLDQAQLATVV